VCVVVSVDVVTSVDVAVVVLVSIFDNVVIAVLVATSVLVVVSSAVLVAVRVFVAVHMPGVGQDEVDDVQVLDDVQVDVVGAIHVG